MKLMTSLACFYLLVLVLFMFKTSFSGDEAAAKFQSFRTGHVSKLSPLFHAKGGSREDTGKDGSGTVLGDEKRRIFTGPNPLHNR